MRSQAKRSQVALHAEGFREASSSRALLTLISNRRAAIAPANRIETPPTACIKITSVSPPPKRKAIAIATSVIALPMILTNASTSIRSLLRKEQANGTNSVDGIPDIMANSVNTTIWPLYPRGSAMATPTAQRKTTAASRIRSALPINAGSSVRPLAISLTRYVPWPQSTMT